MRSISRNLLVAVASVLATASAASASQLLSFEAAPISPNLPELVFTNGAVPQLQAGSGSVGNADGLLPLPSQTPGGLELETPFTVSSTGAIALATGGTEFDDTTLILSNLSASALASNAGEPVISQPLGPANVESPTPTFTFLSTDPDGAGPLTPATLLTGTITSATITALDGGSTASVLSVNVNYTGGAIYNALLASVGQATITGSLSWALLDITNANNSNPFVSIDPGTHYFVPFTANASGLFSYSAQAQSQVPEPASAMLLALPTMAFLARRKRVAVR